MYESNSRGDYYNKSQSYTTPTYIAYGVSCSAARPKSRGHRKNEKLEKHCYRDFLDDRGKREGVGDFGVEVGKE